jgi:hypothetical protein
VSENAASFWQPLASYERTHTQELTRNLPADPNSCAFLPVVWWHLAGCGAPRSVSTLQARREELLKLDIGSREDLQAEWVSIYLAGAPSKSARLSPLHIVALSQLTLHVREVEGGLRGGVLGTDRPL